MGAFFDALLSGADYAVNAFRRILVSWHRR